MFSVLLLLLLLLLLSSNESIRFKTSSIHRIKHLYGTVQEALETETVVISDNLKPFLEILQNQGLAPAECFRLTETISTQGFECVNDIVLFAKDFESRPELLSSILQKDFFIKPLDSHKLRAAMLQTLAPNHMLAPVQNIKQSKSSMSAVDTNTPTSPSSSTALVKNGNELLFKQFKVVKQQKHHQADYGAKEADISPELNHELDQFLSFMTIANPRNQEPPIRHATGI